MRSSATPGVVGGPPGAGHGKVCHVEVAKFARRASVAARLGWSERLVNGEEVPPADTWGPPRNSRRGRGG